MAPGCASRALRADMPAVRCAPSLSLTAVSGLPRVAPGADLAGLIFKALVDANHVLSDGDVLVVTSKIVSRAEGRFVDLSQVTPCAQAEQLARHVGKDA